MGQLYFTSDGESVQLYEFDSGVAQPVLPAGARSPYSQPIRTDLAQNPTPNADIPPNLATQDPDSE